MIADPGKELATHQNQEMIEYLCMCKAPHRLTGSQRLVAVDVSQCMFIFSVYLAPCAFDILLEFDMPSASTVTIVRHGCCVLLQLAS